MLDAGALVAVDQRSRQIGTLLAASGTADVVDGHVAIITKPDDTVITSDLDDIRKHLMLGTYGRPSPASDSCCATSSVRAAGTYSPPALPSGCRPRPAAQPSACTARR